MGQPARTTEPQSPLVDMTVKITQAMRDKVALNLKKARVQLALHHPFFAQIVLNRKLTLADDVPTAYITSRGHITLGVRFAAAINVQQLVFLLSHEAMHFALLHTLRLKHRLPRKWNVAGDAVINDVLISSSVGEFIDGGVNMPGSKDKTSEKVYDELPDQDGGGKGVYVPGEGWNDLKVDDEQLDEATMREIEEQIKVELSQASQVAKMQGKLPVGVESLLDEIINPPTPWHKLLEPYMMALVNSDYSFRRPRKSMMAACNIYLPTTDRVPAMGTVVIQSDESGSIGDAERQHFGGHINAILERCRPERVIVLHTDTQVHKVEEFTLDDLPIQFKTYACGGTDMCAGLEWVEKNGIEPEVFITLTDGYTPFPDKDPSYPLVWLITTDVKAPVGDTIPYEIC